MPFEPGTTTTFASAGQSANARREIDSVLRRKTHSSDGSPASAPSGTVRTFFATTSIFARASAVFPASPGRNRTATGKPGGAKAPSASAPKKHAVPSAAIAATSASPAATGGGSASPDSASAVSALSA